ncbi:MAG: GCG_CRPN prefix-to-repeats domain-containing protein, partial [Xanthobacteraceae bacterium]
AGGCGPGWHRGPWGGCRRNFGPGWRCIWRYGRRFCR